MKDRGLSLKQVAARLGCGYSTAYALVSAGKIPAYRAGGWRVDESDLEAFIARQKTANQPAAPTAGDDPDEALGPIPQEYRL